MSIFAWRDLQLHSKGYTAFGLWQPRLKETKYFSNSMFRRELLVDSPKTQTLGNNFATGRIHELEKLFPAEHLQRPITNWNQRGECEG